MNHLAIDLETLSLEPNAHILSIGAVFFDPATGAMGDQFYVEYAGVAHNALDDARFVATRMLEVVR